MNRYKYIDEKKEHLHTLDGKPLIGTSTVAKILGGDKTGGLMWWASGMAIGKLGWTSPKIKDGNGKVIGTVPEKDRLKIAGDRLYELEDMTTEQYLALLDEAYKAHDTKKKDSGVKGTDRHALLEIYVKLMISDQAGKPLEMNSYEDESVKSFVLWAKDNVKRFLWSELHGYNEELWTGGIADVGWEDNQGRVIAGDFKSSKEAYLDQFIQIAGYDLEISHSGGLDKDGNKIFELPGSIQGYCVVPFGGETLTLEMEYDVEKWKEGFKYALGLHKLSTQFKQ